jgi:hypothetical protein
MVSSASPIPHVAARWEMSLPCGAIAAALWEPPLQPSWSSRRHRATIWEPVRHLRASAGANIGAIWEPFVHQIMKDQSPIHSVKQVVASSDLLSRT